jgi:signal transduction histidine kinase
MSQEFVKLEVADKGKGFPPEILTESKLDSKTALGVGLRGMAERARQLGGNFEVSASPQGTTVRASVPRQESISASSVVTSPAETHQIHEAQGAK